MKNHSIANIVLSIVLVLLIGSFAILFTSHKQNLSNVISNLTIERDSLLVINSQQDSSLSAVNDYVNTIAEALDSIRQQEKILTLQVDENGRVLTKNQILHNLELLSDVIQRQRSRIEELEAQLIWRKQDSSSSYRSLIANLYKEIDSKNETIALMHEELNRRGAMITRLNNQVSILEEDIIAQEETIAQQTQVLEAQDKQINTAYVMIAPKKKLKEKGLLTKGLFTGGNLNAASVDISNFDVVDIRDFQEVTLSVSKIKILTSHPSSSFEIIKDETEDGTDITIFRIKNISSFWSLSNYLVIQL